MQADRQLEKSKMFSSTKVASLAMSISPPPQAVCVCVYEKSKQIGMRLGNIIFFSLLVEMFINTTFPCVTEHSAPKGRDVCVHPKRNKCHPHHYFDDNKKQILLQSLLFSVVGSTEDSTPHLPPRTTVVFCVFPIPLPYCIDIFPMWIFGIISSGYSKSAALGKTFHKGALGPLKL
ncbi:hypothetical protein, no similarity [Maudiozyma saulgeensis]|uniref:Uncharacterized protein n=1 Tax=Maudiozyma saulgeensis TaxID=1789683 RepID=A0A1X7R2Z9_9SACH|nr:hypothetical protein, no similarity [Kazachstania saulgeensis]